MIVKSSTKNYEVKIHQSLSFIEEIQIDENTMLVIDQTLYDLYNEYFEVLKLKTMPNTTTQLWTTG